MGKYTKPTWQNGFKERDEYQAHKTPLTSWTWETRNNAMGGYNHPNLNLRFENGRVGE